MPEDQGGGGEKTEDPTPKKLKDAREEGQVAVSQDVSTLLILLIGLAMLAVIGPALYQQMAASVRLSLLDGLRWEPSIERSIGVLWQYAEGSVWLTLAFACGTTLIGFIAVTGQVGLYASVKPIMPKWSKLSPLAGLKRIFGLRGLMKFVTNLLKLGLVLTVAYWGLSVIIPDEVFYRSDIDARFEAMCWTILKFGFEMVAVLLIVALLDFMYQKWQYRKDMLMTKQEVKEEFKQSEGDPLVKGKI